MADRDAAPGAFTSAASPVIWPESFSNSRSAADCSFSSPDLLAACWSSICRITSLSISGFRQIPLMCCTTAPSKVGADTDLVRHLFHPRWCALTQT